MRHGRHGLHGSGLASLAADSGLPAGNAWQRRPPGPLLGLPWPVGPLRRCAPRSAQAGGVAGVAAVSVAPPRPARARERDGQRGLAWPDHRLDWTAPPQTSIHHEQR